MKNLQILNSLAALGLMFFLYSCGSSGRSGATGWSYNKSENGGFEKTPYVDQETGPGLVLIEGGTFTMGRVEDDVNFSWDAQPTRVTVSSFYIDETEVTNLDWREYLYWLKRIYGDSYPEVYRNALPDTLVWREKMEYNEPYVELYLRHPAYDDYPVVGVNWLQASDYCEWRTDRVNELILIREGLLVHNPSAQVDEEHFTTDSYFGGQYEGEKANDGITDFNPVSSGYRNIELEDGILLPRYRLPTEAEWEYAALGLIGNSYDELITNRKTYPWNGHYVRNDSRPGDKYTGKINANFVRGRGDMMGVAGKLNDNADITAPVYSYPPNDYGLYNMAGNVSEWVMDVYRPLSPEDKSEFRAFRGNKFQTKVLDSEGFLAPKYDYVIYDLDGIQSYLETYKKLAQSRLRDSDLNLLDNVNSFLDGAKDDLKENDEEEAMYKVQEGIDAIKDSESTFASDLLDGISEYVLAQPGELRKRDVSLAENIDRRNYRKSDNIDYLDGDFDSSIRYGDESYENKQDARMYDWGKTTLVNDKARVYKGGSWRDRAYWTIPGSRRFLDERQRTATIGFRCAMHRVGSPVGIAWE